VSSAPSPPYSKHVDTFTRPTTPPNSQSVSQSIPLLFFFFADLLPKALFSDAISAFQNALLTAKHELEI
jgi:hypothetical protein